MKKVCKKCRIFFTGEKCPICGGTDFTTNWQGKISVLDPAHSQIAKELELKYKGDYAIKVR